MLHDLTRCIHASIAEQRGASISKAGRDVPVFALHSLHQRDAGHRHRRKSRGTVRIRCSKPRLQQCDAAGFRTGLCGRRDGVHWRANVYQAPDDLHAKRIRVVRVGHRWAQRGNGRQLGRGNRFGGDCRRGGS